MNSVLRVFLLACALVAMTVVCLGPKLFERNDGMVVGDRVFEKDRSLIDATRVPCLGDGSSGSRSVHRLGDEDVLFEYARTARLYYHV